MFSKKQAKCWEKKWEIWGKEVKKRLSNIDSEIKKVKKEVREEKLPEAFEDFEIWCVRNCSHWSQMGIGISKAPSSDFLGIDILDKNDQGKKIPSGKSISRFAELYKWINKVPTDDVASRARNVMGKAQIDMEIRGDFETRVGSDDFYIALSKVVLLYLSSKSDRDR